MAHLMLALIKLLICIAAIGTTMFVITGLIIAIQMMFRVRR